MPEQVLRSPLRSQAALKLNWKNVEEDLRHVAEDFFNDDSKELKHIL